MTKEAIVMEYLRADFFNMETVSEAWAALAEKFGWKGYEAEMNAHIQKTGDRNPYRDTNNGQWNNDSNTEGASSDGGSGGSSENGEAPKTQESSNGAEAAPSEQPTDTPPPQPSVEERMAAKFAGL
jgi:hypothetical protein